MMEQNTEKWSKAASLFIRVPLGLFFLMAGISKLSDPTGFVEMVKSFEILPDSLAQVYGYALPYAEIIGGGAAILGLLTRWAGLLMSLLLLSFVIAMGVVIQGGGPFNKDIILLGAAISLVFTGSYFWSVDGVMKK